MKTLRLLLLIVVATIAFSCTSQSGRMTRAVIIDSNPRASDNQTTYKVKVLSYDIIDFVVAYHNYEAGDTVLIHDKYRNYEIR